MYLGIFPGICFELQRLTVVALYLWLFFRFLVQDASGLVPAPVQGLLLDAGSLEVPAVHSLFGVSFPAGYLPTLLVHPWM